MNPIKKLHIKFVFIVSIFLFSSTCTSLKSGSSLEAKEIFENFKKINNLNSDVPARFVNLTEAKSLSSEFNLILNSLEKNKFFTKSQVENLKKNYPPEYTNPEIMEKQFKNDEIIVAPNGIIKLNLSSYCLNKGIPAPKYGEQMKLVPISDFICSDLIPIYKGLMTQARLDTKLKSNVQGLVWTLRSVCENPENLVNLSKDSIDLLDKATPNGSDSLKNFQKNSIDAKNKTNSILSVFNDIDKSYSSFVDNDQLQLSIENEIKELEKKPVNEPIPESDSEYTLLRNNNFKLLADNNEQNNANTGIVAKIISPGGAGQNNIEIVNSTDEPYNFKISDYAAHSERNVQNTGFDGNVENKDVCEQECQKKQLEAIKKLQENKKNSDELFKDADCLKNGINENSSKEDIQEAIDTYNKGIDAYLNDYNENIPSTALDRLDNIFKNIDQLSNLKNSK